MSKVNLKIIGLYQSLAAFTIITKLMTKRLAQFFEKNRILSKHQYGSRKNRTCLN